MQIDGRQLEVLLCEDSVGDVRLTREAFRDVNKTVNLHVATDGVEAIAFLRDGDHRSASPSRWVARLSICGTVQAEHGSTWIPGLRLSTKASEASRRG
jgi:hypothetical protein